MRQAVVMGAVLSLAACGAEQQCARNNTSRTVFCDVAGNARQAVRPGDVVQGAILSCDGIDVLPEDECQ